MARCTSAVRRLRVGLCAIACAGLGVLASALHAQPTTARRPAAGVQPVATATAGAPVIVGNDTLFRLYASLGPFSAAMRASAATARLGALVRSGVSDADSIHDEEREGRSDIVSRDVVLFTVLDADAKPTGRPRAALAAEYALTARRAVRVATESMSSRSLIVDVSEALAVTAALIVVLWALRWATRRVQRRIDALHDMRVPALRIQQLELLSAGRLASLLTRFLRVLRLLFILLALYVYVPLVLSLFPWTAGLSHQIVGYAVEPFIAAAVAVAGYLPNLFYLAAGVVITRYSLGFLHLIFDAIGSGSITVGGFYADWAEPTYKIVRALVLAFAVTVMYPFLPGTSSDAFKGVSIFLGVLVSFGSSAAIGNVVAGVVLTYTRAFQIGDRVKIGDTVGDVVEKTLLVTRVRTIKNVAVTVPNGTVLSSQVVNYSTLASSHGLILHTTVTIGYDAPWQRVHELLIDAAGRTAHVLRDPSPFVLQTSLDDFYVSYELNAYTDRADLMAATYSTLHENIQESFNEGGVEIMSPHYAALRDGNQTTIPRGHLAARYEPPAFRVRATGEGTRGGS